MGNQGHDGQGIRRQVEWVNAGLIGTITETHTWTGRPVWPQGMGRPGGQDPVPPNLDWECWIGPAPMRPYKNGVYHDFKWRGWYDFGTGAVGDMGCHTFDSVYWSMGSPVPISVECINATSLNKETYPLKAVYRWEFAARAEAPGLHGLLVRERHEAAGAPGTGGGGQEGFGGSGSLLVGTKGYHRQRGRLLQQPASVPGIAHGRGPEDSQDGVVAGLRAGIHHGLQAGKALGLPEIELHLRRRHLRDAPPGQPHDPRRPEQETAVGLQEPEVHQRRCGANEFVTRTYRKGWEL